MEAAVVASIVPAGLPLVKGLPEIHGAYIALQDLSPRIPKGMTSRVAEIFDLTPREAELAIALVSGQTVSESAAARNLSVTTVRTQLAHLFRKTGTSRQCELVSVLMSASPVLFFD